MNFQNSNKLYDAQYIYTTYSKLKHDNYSIE